MHRLSLLTASSLLILFATPGTPSRFGEKRAPKGPDEAKI